MEPLNGDQPLFAVERFPSSQRSNEVIYQRVLCCYSYCILTISYEAGIIDIMQPSPFLYS